VRAVVLDAEGLPQLAEVPAPSPPGTLVRVRACGLCGSDVEKLGHGTPGSVLGHEIAGELEDGTRVTVMHRVPCGACERCRAGHGSTCEAFCSLRVTPGGFAEEVRATHIVELPAALAELDGIWVEPLACVLRAAERVPRGRVLVVGCGAIGRLWLQILQARGDEALASDPLADRLAGALELGAIADGGAVDAAVLTAPAGLNDALGRLRPGGTLLVFAATSDPLETNLDAVYRRELRLVGSRSATPEFFDAAVRLLPALKLPPATILPLERFRDGIDLYRRGRALKVVFTP
jgi:L-iditol 2-dehydrogenase